MNKRYFLYGLTIELPFAFPALCESGNGVDVTVAIAPINRSGFKWKDEELCHKATPEAYLFWVDGIGRYLVRGGRYVTIEPAKGADPAALKLFFLNPVLGALLMQRGALPFQGSCVVHRGRAYALLGVSAAGKSFLAAGLKQRGFKILADNLCGIADAAQPMVAPGYPFLMLWRRGLQLLGERVDRLAPVRTGLEKYVYPLGEAAENRPMPLAGIYLLHNHNRETFEFETLTGFEKMFRMLDYTYHEPLVRAMGMHKQQQKIGAGVTRAVPVKRYRFFGNTDGVRGSIDTLAGDITGASF